MHTRDAVSAEVEAEIATMESADIVVAATPVYRGSYPENFKHFFDLVYSRIEVGLHDSLPWLRTRTEQPTEPASGFAAT